MNLTSLIANWNNINSLGLFTNNPSSKTCFENFRFHVFIRKYYKYLNKNYSWWINFANIWILYIFFSRLGIMVYKLKLLFDKKKCNINC